MTLNKDLEESDTGEEERREETVNETDNGESEETNVEDEEEEEDDDDDEEEEEEDSGNDEDFLSEELNLPETDQEETEVESVPDYPIIMDDSEEDRIFKRQLAYPPIPMYHPPLTLSAARLQRQQELAYHPHQTYQQQKQHQQLQLQQSYHQQMSNINRSNSKSTSGGGRHANPRDKIGMLTPMEEVTEPPSSAATSIDGDHPPRSRSRNNRRVGRNNNYHHNLLNRSVQPLSPATQFPHHPPPLVSPMEAQKSILKSRENLLQNVDNRMRTVTFERGANSSSSPSSLPQRGRRSPSPPESLASNTSEYSSMAESGGRNNKHQGIQRTITEEEETTEQEPDNFNSSKDEPEESYQPPPSARQPFSKSNNIGGGAGNLSNQKRNSTDLGLISDMEQGEKVIQWQMGNAKSESSCASGDGSGGSGSGGGGDGSIDHGIGGGGGTGLSLDSEFASIVNGIIAELHNLDELIGSSSYRGAMEMNASKQDHLANVSTQLATYLAQVSPQTVMTNLPQVIPLVTSLLYLTGSNFRSQLASLTAVNVFIERLRDCKVTSGLRVLPNADLTWLVRALCEISSESSRSVLKNEGILALARLIKTAGPEMVFDPILFILMGNDEKVRKQRRRPKGQGQGGFEEEEEDRIVIPTGGPGGAPKIKAIALDSLTFALLTFPRDDFNLDLVAKLACHCLLHPKRRMRQASLECLAVISHALGSHIALPMFRQVIMEEQEEIRRQNEAPTEQSSCSISSEASAPVSCASEAEGEPDPPRLPPSPSKIPVPLSKSDRLDNANSANNTLPISPQKLKPHGSPISAVSARISRHLLPQPSLSDLVEYAVKIPATSRILSRQNLKVSKQVGVAAESVDVGSGGESVDGNSVVGSGSGSGGGSANVTLGRNGSRVASSSGTSSSSVTNVKIELEPVLNAIGSGNRNRKLSQINEVAGSLMAADVAWILNGTGPIKACDGTSVLAPIYRMAEQQLLVSDMNLTSTHLRQLGMIHSSGLDSDSNSVSETFNQQLNEKIRRGSLALSNNNPSNTLGQIKPANNNPNGSGDDQISSDTDPSMSRFGYYGGGNNGNGRGGASSSDNNNGGGAGGSRISSNGSYSLLPNKYSLLASSSLNGMRGGAGGGGSSLQLSGDRGDPMMSPHHVPSSSFQDYSHYGSSLEGIDGYGGTDLYGTEPPTSLRAPSRNNSLIGGGINNKMGPMTGVHSLRQKYFDSQQSTLVTALGGGRHHRGGLMKGSYTDEEEEEDDEDAGIVNHGGSESSQVSSDEEDDLLNHHSSASAAALKQQQQEAALRAAAAERRASQVSLSKSASQTGNSKKNSSRKSSKGGKSGKNKNKGQKDKDKTLSSSTEQPGNNSNVVGNTAMGGGEDKVEQIVNRLQQEYQVFRVDRVELDQSGGPSPEEMAAAAKKKRGELDSAGSNSRDSGVSIGAGSVASAVHTPAGGDSQTQQQPSSSVTPDDEENSTSVQTNTEGSNGNNSTGGNGNSSKIGSGGSGGSSGKKEGSKRKSSLKTGKKSSGQGKVVQHAIDGGGGGGDDDRLSRNWKSTPDVASIMDDYEPRMTNYRKLSTTEHDMMGNGVSSSSPYHSSSALAGENNNNYMTTLHRKPVLAGGQRRQSLIGRASGGGGGSGGGIDLGELEDRQLALIPHQEGGRSSRLQGEYGRENNNSKYNSYGSGGGGGSGYLQPGYGSHHHLNSQESSQDIYQQHHSPHRQQQPYHSSMLDIDKASPSRESSAGSGNTYSLHPQQHQHYSSSSHNLRSSKSTGNLLGIGGGEEHPYRQPIRGGGGGATGGYPMMSNASSYYDMMDMNQQHLLHPGSPGRRMMNSRMGMGSHHLMNNHHLADLGNSTDDMEFPMTPQSESSSNTLPKQSRGMGMMSNGGRMNGKVMPKKIYKGSFREVNARSKGGVLGGMNTELFPMDLKPVSSPKHALPAALLQVQASDWETNVDGFRQLVRLARHHPEFIRSDLHNVNMNALRHVMNLRSQVCRAAILFFRELFMNIGKAMEHDSERIAEKLLDKAADTNKFIREDSGKALEALVLGVSPAKALTCLDLYGTRHRNPAVRSMTARMTTKLIDKLGADRSLSEVPERLLPMLCRFLQEGSLDTRMSAKLAFSVLMESPSFDTQLKRHVQADTLRHVQKAMKAITTKS